MKKLAIVLFVLLAPVFCLAQIDTATTITKSGAAAPTFDFNLTKDQKTNLKAYRGKIVMINFFATWCGPCKLELPRVQKEVWEKYKDNPKFALLVFDREEGWDVIRAFKEKNQYTLPMLPDEGRKIFSLYATEYIPRNVVIDENGKIIYQSIGYEEKEFDKLLDLLAAKLKVNN